MSEFYPDIWRLQAQGDIRGLIEAIKHTSPDVRRRAVAALRALGASSAIPALQAALVKEQDTEVRRAIILTLDSLFQQEVDEDSDSSEDQYTQVVRLIAQLSSKQPERIIRAARRLGELKEKIAAESLILVFHNNELPSRVRLAAAEALLELESAPIEVALLGALRHSDWRVRRNAIAVLGQLDADWAVEPLREALKDSNDLIQRTAQAALKRIGTPEALIALAAASIEEIPTTGVPSVFPTKNTKVEPAAETAPESTNAPAQVKKEATAVVPPALVSSSQDEKTAATRTPPIPPGNAKLEQAAETTPAPPNSPGDTKAAIAPEPPTVSATTEKTESAAEVPPAPVRLSADGKMEAAVKTPTTQSPVNLQATVNPPPPAHSPVDGKTETAVEPPSAPALSPVEIKVEAAVEPTATSQPAQVTQPPAAGAVLPPDEEDTQPILPVS